MLTLLAVVACLALFAGLIIGIKDGFGSILIAAGMVLLLIWSAIPAHSRDLGQWENTNPEIRKFYQSLMQPDNPTVPCCGEADAYWCDSYRFEGGKALCTISDDRADEPRNRPHVPVGTVIEIPNYKLKWDKGNPDGHGIVFLSSSGLVYCYVQPGGV